MQNFNPRSPHGERPSTLTISEGFHLISIHALLTESDQTAAENAQDAAISIHALLTESDVGCYQSGSIVIVNFNPRSPHGERRNRLAVPLIHGLISIHALLTESDVRIVDHLFGQRDFNPRSPHGERLLLRPHLYQLPDFNPRSPHGERLSIFWHIQGSTIISIHALLTESDLLHQLHVDLLGNFNPRSPHGERPEMPGLANWILLFQSTLSSRRATRSSERH